MAICLAFNENALRIILGLSIILVTAFVYFIVFPGPIEAHSKILVYVASLIIGVIILLSAFYKGK